jgi:hypothetical protein
MVEFQNEEQENTLQSYKHPLTQTNGNIEKFASVPTHTSRIICRLLRMPRFPPRQPITEHFEPTRVGTHIKFDLGALPEATSKSSGQQII